MLAPFVDAIMDEKSSRDWLVCVQGQLPHSAHASVNLASPAVPKVSRGTSVLRVRDHPLLHERSLTCFCPVCDDQKPNCALVRCRCQPR